MVASLSYRHSHFACQPRPGWTTIRHMHRLLTLRMLLFVSASLSVIAQTPVTPSPSPTPVTLRSALLAELQSSHDKAEWVTPMNTAVAGLTAEQAKWVPHNAQDKLDPQCQPLGRHADLSPGLLERERARAHSRRKAHQSE